MGRAPRATRVTLNVLVVGTKFKLSLPFNSTATSKDYRIYLPLGPQPRVRQALTASGGLLTVRYHLLCGLVDTITY